jgi:DNA polymerase epsilon subunit 1
VKYELLPIVEKNKLQRETADAYEGWYNPSEVAENRKQSSAQYLSKIIDIREFDVAYHIRCMIDNEIRCSFWYEVAVDGPLLKTITHLTDKLDKADLRVMAFDIETTTQPLKFPDSKFDQVMMISYIIDGKGFLITNRQVVGADVQDFEYSPKPEYDVGQFKVFNEADEKALLIKFFDHIRETKPCIFTTFNGDYFDWPFIQDRAEYYQLKIEEEIGIYNSTN